MKSLFVGTVAAATALFVSGAAFAQEVQAQGQAQTNVGVGLGGQAAGGGAQQGGSDHMQMIGRPAFGFLGRQTMQIATPAGGGVAPAPVNVPVVGVRYWVNPLIGIDAGLGFSMTTGSVEAPGVDVDKTGVTAFMVHGGVPIALASSGHFTFEVVPEANFGYAAASVDGADVDLSGLHLDIGARVGAEIHFGFIDIPELSLQGSVGAALQLDNVSADSPAGEASDSTLTIGTTLGNDPWDIFTSSISALYYF